MAPKAEGPTPEEDEAAEREAERRSMFDAYDRMCADEFASQVSRGKPILDFVAMIGILAVVSTIFFVTLYAMLRDGWSDRNGAILFTAVVLWWNLNIKVSYATIAQVNRCLNYLLSRTRAPHPTLWSSRTLKLLWDHFAIFVGVLATMTIVAMGYEIAKTARQLGEQKPPIAQDAKSRAAPVVEAPISPTDDRNVAP